MNEEINLLNETAKEAPWCHNMCVKKKKKKKKKERQGNEVVGMKLKVLIVTGLESVILSRVYVDGLLVLERIRRKREGLKPVCISEMADLWRHGRQVLSSQHRCIGQINLIRFSSPSKALLDVVRVFAGLLQ